MVLLISDLAPLYFSFYLLNRFSYLSLSLSLSSYKFITFILMWACL